MNNPTALLVIIVVIAAVIASVVLTIQNNRRKNKIKELDSAARKLIKEQTLSESLRNADNPRGKKKCHTQERIRMVTALEWKEGEKDTYVFDPLEGIRIGRAYEGNNVCIQDNEISQYHCMIYQAGRDLIIEDKGSSNGTVIVHGLKKGRVRGRARIFDGDKILIGKTEILVYVFWIDAAYL